MGLKKYMKLKQSDICRYNATPEERAKIFEEIKEAGLLAGKRFRKKGVYTGTIVTCMECNKEFYVSKTRFEAGRVKYCSRKCYHKNIFGEKNPFYGHKHSEDFIRKHKERMERNPPPGRPPNPQLIRFREAGNFSYTLDVKNENYLKRVVNKCEVCGFDEDPSVLTIHHKDKNRKNNIDNNLIVLCPNHHAMAHSRYIGPTARNHYVY